MGCRNKLQRQLEALAQAHRAPYPENEDFDIVYYKPESGDAVIDINMESFRSVIKSNLNKVPLYYSMDSYSMNRRRRSDIIKATKMMGQDLFAVWGIPNPSYTKKYSKIPVTVRQYAKRDIFLQALSESMELVNYIYGCLQKKRHMKRA